MLDRFIEYISIEKRYSPNTVLSYRKDLEDFTQFLLNTESHVNFTKVDKKIVRNFMVEMGLKKIVKKKYQS